MHVSRHGQWDTHSVNLVLVIDLFKLKLLAIKYVIQQLLALPVSFFSPIYVKRTSLKATPVVMHIIYWLTVAASAVAHPIP